MLADTPVLIANRIALYHLGIEHPQVTVDPAEVVLHRERQHRRVELWEDEPHGHLQRHVAQLPKIRLVSVDFIFVIR